MIVRIGKWAWMDGLSDVEKTQLEKMLTIYPAKMAEYGQISEPIRLYRHGNTGEFGVARSYFLEKRTKNHKIIDMTTDGEPMSKFNSLVKFDGIHKEQRIAIDTLKNKMNIMKLGGLILDAEPGTGKTVMALQLAFELGRKTMVLVHKEFLLSQWSDRIKQFFPDARIGYVWQNKCEYENVDFTIGMIQSMTGGRDLKYPKEMFESYGLVITDEVHRIGSLTWSDVISMFSARWRLGVSGTVRRKDGAENVFYYHIGKKGYKLKTQSLIPKIKRLILDTNYSEYFAKTESGYSYKIPFGKMKTVHHIGALVEHRERNEYIIDQVEEALKAGRKIMVLSERLEHLKDLSEMLAERMLGLELGFRWRFDFYTGEWFTGKYKIKTIKTKLRIKKIEVETKRKRSESELQLAGTANVIFSTKQMVAEALDVPSLDVLILATPFSDVEQAVGRIRRPCKPSDKCYATCPWRAEHCQGKPDPIVVDIIDRDIFPIKRKWYTRSKYYVKIGAMSSDKAIID